VGAPIPAYVSAFHSMAFCYRSVLACLTKEVVSYPEVPEEEEQAGPAIANMEQMDSALLDAALVFLPPFSSAWLRVTRLDSCQVKKQQGGVLFSKQDWLGARSAYMKGVAYLQSYEGEPAVHLPKAVAEATGAGESKTERAPPQSLAAEFFVVASY
jgi:hypothetical protein